MSQNKFIQPIAYIILTACVLISGYILLSPGKQSDGQPQSQNISGLTPVVDGKQIVKTTVGAVRYEPSSFKVKAGIPVRFEATSSGQPGCASGSIISKLFTGGSMYLNPSAGEVAVNEFTPKSPGKYAFTCPMGMVKGTIEVVN